MYGRLLMMPSFSQVLDHQLIFHIMYGLGQFHHQQNKGEERRGEIWQKKSNSCLINIERKRCKKSSSCFPNIEDRKCGKNRGEGRSRVEQRRVVVEVAKKQQLLRRGEEQSGVEESSSRRGVVEQQEKSKRTVQQQSSSRSSKQL